MDLENQYLCRSGQIEQIGKRAGWLLDAAAGIAKVMHKDRKISFFLKRLSLRLNFGVDESGVKFARLRVPGLGRDFIWSLIQKGYSSFKQIKEAKLEELGKVIPMQVAQKLKEKVAEKSKPSRRQKRSDPKNKHLWQKKDPTKDDIQLIIDGTPVKDKFLILVNGRKINLPAKSFKYLVKLVWAVFQNDGGWIHKNDFEPGENQTRYLHRLKKQITPALNPGQSFLENNRLGGYRLTFPMDKISINSALLLKNPDMEIKKIAEELA